MADADQYPVGQEDRAFQHQEILRFKDGGLALKFGTPGDRVLLGPDSKHKYAEHFDWDDQVGSRAIIRTASGNQYWLGGGFVINVNEQKTYPMPDATIDLRIGEPCTIPGVSQTTNVDAVLLDYNKIAAPGYGDRQVDIDNPFYQVQGAIKHIRQQMAGQQGGA